MTKSLGKFKLEGIDKTGKELTYTEQDFLGKKLVVYFYPKDNTPGCTKEACNFNNIISDINIFANIIGVSADNIQSHKNFREKYSLNFPLICDTNLELATRLGAVKENNKITRATFIFDEKGNLIKEWLSVKVDGHDSAVLKELQES